MVKKSKEQFIKEAHAIWGNVYDYTSSLFLGSKQPIRIYCPKHDHFFVVSMAQNHIINPKHGVKPTGCPVCAYEQQTGKKYGTEWRSQLKLSKKQNRVGKIDDDFRKEAMQRAALKALRMVQNEKKRKEREGLMKKLGAKDSRNLYFLQHLQQEYPDIYDTHFVDYKDRDIPVTLICKEHGEFQITARQLFGYGGKKKHGCWKCAGLTPPWEKPKPQKMTADEFFQQMQGLYGDHYDFSNSVFPGLSGVVDYECKEHGHQHNSVHALLEGKGCDYCSGRRFWGPGFERIAREKHGDKYNYSQVEEIKKKTQVVTIECPVHGPFLQRADLHLIGHGCPECYGQSNKWDAKERGRRFFEKARKIHGEQFDYSEANYVNKRTHIRIRCKKHDYWFTCRPDEHIHVRSGGCCPYCTAPKSELEVMAWLDAHRIPYIHNKPLPNNDPTLPLQDLKADFYLECNDERIIIETNGEQHYKEVSFFKKKSRSFQIQQHRDIYLRQYCKGNRITLLEIPFTEFDCIPLVLDNFFKDRVEHDNCI